LVTRRYYLDDTGLLVHTVYRNTATWMTTLGISHAQNRVDCLEFIPRYTLHNIMMIIYLHIIAILHLGCCSSTTLGHPCTPPWRLRTRHCTHMCNCSRAYSELALLKTVFRAFNRRYKKFLWRLTAQVVHKNLTVIFRPKYIFNLGTTNIIFACA